MANTISQIHINDKDYDIRDKSAAPIDSPAFTGTPTAPTADAKDDSGRIATTAFVQKAIKENASSNPGSGGGGSNLEELNIHTLLNKKSFLIDVGSVKDILADRGEGTVYFKIGSINITPETFNLSCQLTLLIHNHSNVYDSEDNYSFVDSTGILKLSYKQLYHINTIQELFFKWLTFDSSDINFNIADKIILAYNTNENYPILDIFYIVDYEERVTLINNLYFSILEESCPNGALWNFDISTEDRITNFIEDDYTNVIYPTKIEITNENQLELGETEDTAFPGDRGLALENKYEEVFQSVSNGKKMIASAITDKGISTNSDATFLTMANNISKINNNSPSSDSAALNIYFGMTSPKNGELEDHSKLWIKTNITPDYFNLSGKLSYTNGFDSNFSDIYLPEVRERASIEVVNSKIYIVGGIEDGEMHQSILVYDMKNESENESYSTIDTSAVYNFDKEYLIKTATVGNNIYIFNDNIILKLDTDTNILTKEPKTSKKLYNGFDCCVIDKTIYFVLAQSRAAISSYNTETQEFKELYSLSDYYFDYPSIGAIDNTLYIFGSSSASSENATYMISYNIENEKVIETNLSFSYDGEGFSGYSGVSTIGKNIYVVGSSAGHSPIYKINTEDNSVSSSENSYFTQLESYLPIATVDDSFYTFYGGNLIKKYTNKGIYVPYYDFYESYIQIYINNFNKNSFCLIKKENEYSVDICIDGVYLNYGEDYTAKQIEAYLYNRDTNQWENIYNT